MTLAQCGRAFVWSRRVAATLITALFWFLGQVWGSSALAMAVSVVTTWFMSYILSGLVLGIFWTAVWRLGGRDDA